jgi:16S rRNA (cytosine967-C5)-methyltransferase
MTADPRALAAQALAGILDGGRSTSEVLPPAQVACADERAAALVQELVYGTLRWYFRLEAVLAQLLRKPLRKGDMELHCLLLLGLYQLDRMALPERVAVHETVQAVRALRREWASGLVNAVLRAFQRRRAELERIVLADEQARYAHPRWLIRQVEADWPERLADIFAAGNERPPFCLRVNRRRLTRSEYLELLQVRGIRALPIPETEQGVQLEAPMPVTRVPGFSAGDVSVQDGAAQLAAVLLDVHPGMRVLDACAAPGGKTAHLLERHPDIEVTALDIDADRLARVQDNLQRLGLRARLLAADAGRVAAWWDGRPFDRILLDAPCSGTGVIRRHPDIKVLRRAADIEGLVARQSELLNTLWPLLVPGGILLYCTCSILKAENSAGVAGFLEVHGDARERPLAPARPGFPAFGRQILPGENGMDGFFYACLLKTV